METIIAALEMRRLFSSFVPSRFEEALHFPTISNMFFLRFFQKKYSFSA